MRKITLNDKMAEQGGDFEVIPEGYHAFTVKERGDVSMSNNGNEFLPVTLTISGIDVKDKLFLGEKSQWRLARFLKSLKGGADLGELEFDPSKCAWIVGKSGQCLIEHEIPTEGKYKGKVFARVKTFDWGKDVSELPNPETPEDDESAPPF